MRVIVEAVALSRREVLAVKRSPFLFLILAVSAVAMLVLASTGAAAPVRTVTLDTTLVATIDGSRSGSWRCGFFWGFDGRATISSLGAVGLDGEYSDGCVPFAEPAASIRRLDLVLVAPSGARLVLVEDVTWLTLEEVEPARTWTVDSTRSTGRFASYSGSGSYAVGETTPPSNQVIVELRGELTISR